MLGDIRADLVYQSGPIKRMNHEQYLLAYQQSYINISATPGSSDVGF
jgi:hypothetical protein